MIRTCGDAEAGWHRCAEPGTVAHVHQQAAWEFLANPAHGDGQTWQETIAGWGAPGSADYAVGFRGLLNALIDAGRGLVLDDVIGWDTRPAGNHSGAVCLEVLTDDQHVSTGFIVRVELRSGARLCSRREDLTYLAQRDGTLGVLGALATVAGLIDEAYVDFTRSARALCTSAAH